MSVINTNVKSLVAQDAIMKNNRDLSTSMQRLSTGSRINSAKDDAAGLAISTRMNSQVRGLSMAIKNANDGISLMQTAEGAMDEVTAILQRMRELAVQSVNGTNNDSDRVALNDEIVQLKSEIDRIASNTEFNNQKILDGSFKDKKLQIGDKAYQTMDVAIGSVATKDLGMAEISTGANTLISSRVNLAAFDAGDIEINGQRLAAFTGSDDIKDLVRNINQNVDNVTASAFNVVVAKQIGTGRTTAGQFNIEITPVDTASATTYAIAASENLNELVANINAVGGDQVQASINEDGKLVLSNNTGAAIKVSDNSQSSGYETASGFEGKAVGAYSTFNGFLKLESKDGSPIRIEAGNKAAEAPGATADLTKIGFRANTSEFSNALDGFTVVGSALAATAMSSSWATNELQINGVNIYDPDIATNSFQGKLDAINNFSGETGVIAYARLDTTISFGTASVFAAVSANGTLSFNGTEVWSSGSTSGSVSLSAIATSINNKTASTGIKAEVNGFNLRLYGDNVTTLKIDAALSGTPGNLMTSLVDDTIYYAGIKLDSADNKPISIQLRDGNDVAQTGFLEQNVGAADFQVNSPYFGSSQGASLSGLNISTSATASAAITTIDNAIEKVSSYRSKLGAMENRLNSAVNNLSNVVTNTAASRSRIQDTDYASETTALAKAQIISQAATAMLAQANQQPQSVLSLLK